MSNLNAFRFVIATFTISSVLVLGCNFQRAASNVEPGTTTEPAAGTAEPVEITSENFQAMVLDSDKPVVIDCWASWCGPCVAFAPVMDELAYKYEGKAVIGKVNVDEQQEIANKFGISAIPTALIFNNGEEIKDFRMTPPTREGLIATIDSLIDEPSGE